MKLARSANTLVIGFLDIYQKTISPFFVGCCRFYPSCSQYAKERFKKNPFHLALFYTFRRLLKCQPLCLGGVDEFKGSGDECI